MALRQESLTSFGSRKPPLPGRSDLLVQTGSGPLEVVGTSSATVTINGHANGGGDGHSLSSLRSMVPRSPSRKGSSEPAPLIPRSPRPTDVYAAALADLQDAEGRSGSFTSLSSRNPQLKIQPTNSPISSPARRRAASAYAPGALSPVASPRAASILNSPFRNPNGRESMLGRMSPLLGDDNGGLCGAAMPSSQSELASGASVPARRVVSAPDSQSQQAAMHTMDPWRPTGHLDALRPAMGASLLASPAIQQLQQHAMRTGSASPLNGSSFTTQGASPYVAHQHQHSMGLSQPGDAPSGASGQLLQGQSLAAPDPYADRGSPIASPGAKRITHGSIHRTDSPPQAAVASHLLPITRQASGSPRSPVTPASTPHTPTALRPKPPAGNTSTGGSDATPQGLPSSRSMRRISALYSPEAGGSQYSSPGPGSSTLLREDGSLAQPLTPAGSVEPLSQQSNSNLPTAVSRFMQGHSLLPSANSARPGSASKRAVERLVDAIRSRDTNKLLDVLERNAGQPGAQSAGLNERHPLTSRTPLHEAVMCIDSLDMISKLLEAGSDPNIGHPTQGPPLLHAAAFGDTSKVELLIDAGADVDAVDDDHCTALHLALRGAHVETARLLMSRRAKHTLRNRAGEVPFDFADGETVKKLFMPQAVLSPQRSQGTPQHSQGPGALGGSGAHGAGAGGFAAAFFGGGSVFAAAAATGGGGGGGSGGRLESPESSGGSLTSAASGSPMAQIAPSGSLLLRPSPPSRTPSRLQQHPRSRRNSGEVNAMAAAAALAQQAAQQLQPQQSVPASTPGASAAFHSAASAPPPPQSAPAAAASSAVAGLQQLGAAASTLLGTSATAAAAGSMVVPSTPGGGVAEDIQVPQPPKLELPRSVQRQLSRGAVLSDIIGAFTQEDQDLLRRTSHDHSAGQQRIAQHTLQQPHPQHPLHSMGPAGSPLPPRPPSFSGLPHNSNGVLGSAASQPLPSSSAAAAVPAPSLPRFVPPVALPANGLAADDAAKPNGAARASGHPAPNANVWGTSLATQVSKTPRLPFGNLDLTAAGMGGQGDDASAGAATARSRGASGDGASHPGGASAAGGGAADEYSAAPPLVRDSSPVHSRHTSPPRSGRGASGNGADRAAGGQAKPSRTGGSSDGERGSGGSRNGAALRGTLSASHAAALAMAKTSTGVPEEVLQVRASALFNNSTEMAADGIEWALGSQLEWTQGKPIEWTQGELLGEGAYGKVYAGLNQKSGELMAVKVLELVGKSRSEETQRQQLAMLKDELSLYMKLRHKHVVGYFGACRDEPNSRLYIFLEYVPGGSIASMLERFGRFSEELVRNYTRQLLMGLEYLHGCKIVHRDLKGGNVLVSRDGVIKLADFGASKAFKDATITDCMKSMRGSVFWMAPEVIKGTGYGRRADVWSLGCTVIEMMTGKHAWPDLDNHWSAMFQIAKSKDGPPRPKNASDLALDFLDKCLHLDPKQRPTASELLLHPFVCMSERQAEGSQLQTAASDPLQHSF